MPQRQCLRAISRRDEVAAFDFRIASQRGSSGARARSVGRRG
jgi:hypothetical protein